jgi:hypothetical protein
MYDVVMPSYIPGCAHGCASWASLSKDVAAMFATADGPRAACQHCAMPANHSGMHECDCGQKDDQRYMTDSYAGPWCYCLEADGTPSTTTAYCTPPNATVEQLNLQIADPTTVVASFVTYEPLPSSAPVAMLGESEDALTTTVLGVSHEYKPPGRDYVLHVRTRPACQRTRLHTARHAPTSSSSVRPTDALASVPARHSTSSLASSSRARRTTTRSSRARTRAATRPSTPSDRATRPA